MQLTKYIEDENIDLDFRANSKEEALRKLAELISHGRNVKIEDVLKVLIEREELGSTGVGNEVAIPHGKLNINEELIGAIAISKEGVEFDSLDGKPVKIFFVFISSPEATNLHLKVLARVSKLLMDENIRYKLINASSNEEVKKIINE